MCTPKKHWDSNTVAKHQQKKLTCPEAINSQVESLHFGEALLPPKGRSAPWSSCHDCPSTTPLFVIASRRNHSHPTKISYTPSVSCRIETICQKLGSKVSTPKWKLHPSFGIRYTICTHHIMPSAYGRSTKSHVLCMIQVHVFPKYAGCSLMALSKKGGIPQFPHPNLHDTLTPDSWHITFSKRPKRLAHPPLSNLEFAVQMRPKPEINHILPI